MSKKGQFDISININGAEVKNSINGLKKAVRDFKKEAENAVNGSEEQKLAEKRFQTAKDKLSDYRAELNGTNSTLNDLRGSWDNMIEGFLSGDIDAAKEGFNGLKTSVNGVSKAAKSLLLSPIGLAVGAFLAIAAATKAWFDFNMEVSKSNEQVRELTGLSGAAVDGVRIRAKVLKDTFGVEVKESIETAKALASNMGITYQEAFDIIEKGAVNGKTKNDEFMASLKEYPVQFKNAGFSAGEFAEVVSTGIDLGVFTDKLPDAIKEADLALKEATPATKEALENAFGASFTDNLLKRVSQGKTTTKQALQEISAEAEKANLNQQQQQQLTADLFKGAGEDAGGALKIFEALNTALDDQEKPLTEIQSLNQENLDVQKELQGVYTALFAVGGGGLDAWIAKGKLFLNKVLLGMLKGGVDIYNWWIDLNNESSIFSAITTGIWESFTLGHKVFAAFIQNAISGLKGLGKMFIGATQMDPKKMAEGWEESKKAFENTFVKPAVESVSKIMDAASGKNKKTRIDIETFFSSEPDPNSNPKTNPTGLGTPENSSNELTEQDKQILESKKRLNEMLKDLDLQEKDQAREREIEQENHRREQEILKAESKEEALRLEQERLDWYGMAQLERLRLLSDEELEIDKQKEKEKLRLKGATEEELKAIDTKYKLKKEKRDADFLKKKRASEKKAAQQKAQSDQQSLENEQLIADQKRQIVSDLFSTIATVLGENTAAGKAAAIAQATMNTWQGVTEVWKSKSETGLVGAGFIQKLATSALTAAQGFAAVRNIMKTKTDIPGKFFGGFTGNKGAFSDEYGPITAYTHADEYVSPRFQVQDPLYSDQINWLESERQNRLGGGATDTYGTPPPNSSGNRDLLQAILNYQSMLYNALISGEITSGEILIGDDQIEALSERQNLLNKTIENSKIGS